MPGGGKAGTLAGDNVTAGLATAKPGPQYAESIESTTAIVGAREHSDRPNKTPGLLLR